VSVVVPVFNRALLLGEAVRSCLSQGTAELAIEVVVVDDGSTDGSAAVAEAFGGDVRCLRHPRNRGRNAARNCGLEASRGDWVKFLDSDDVLLPGSLAEEVRCGRETGADIVVSGWCDGHAAEGGALVRGRCWPAPRFGSVPDDLLAGKAVPTAAALYRRAFVGRLRWDTGLEKLDDWDWFVRAALDARSIERVDGVSYLWRQHPLQGVRSSLMVDNAREHHAILGKLERQLDGRGELTRARRERLAQYYYKELRVLALGDREAFERGVRHVRELDPGFWPRDEEGQVWMRAACRWLGTRRAILLHCWVKGKVRGPGAAVRQRAAGGAP
jgi:hypothetical protein